jgi:hypothetical protein
VTAKGSLVPVPSAPLVPVPSALVAVPSAVPARSSGAAPEKSPTPTVSSLLSRRDRGREGKIESANEKGRFGVLAGERVGGRVTDKDKEADRQTQTKRQAHLDTSKEGLNASIISGGRQGYAPGTREQNERWCPSSSEKLADSLLGRRGAPSTDDNAIRCDSHVAPASRAGVLRAEKGQGIAVHV